MESNARLDINIMTKRRKKLFSIAKTRRALYKSARILGDVNAIKRGPKAIIKRTLRKQAGRGLGRGLKRILK